MLSPAADPMNVSLVFVDGDTDALHRSDDWPVTVPLTKLRRYLRITNAFNARKAAACDSEEVRAGAAPPPPTRSDIRSTLGTARQWDLSLSALVMLFSARVELGRFHPPSGPKPQHHVDGEHDDARHERDLRGRKAWLEAEDQESDDRNSEY